MALIRIPFGHNPGSKLLPLGVKIPTLVGNVELDENSAFEPPVAVHAHIDNPSLVEVGAFTSIAGGKIGGARIGRYCAIAPDVIIGAHEHPTNWLTCSRVAHYPVMHGWDTFCRPDDAAFVRKNAKPFKGARPITTLGHDVWIGQGAFIRSGVTLGTGCVVGARSVVVKDVPPYAVVAGIPATVKRYRFDERVIARLLALQWWRFSLYDCFQVPFDQVEAALDALEELVAAGTLPEYRPDRLTAKDLAAMFSAEPPARVAAA